MDIALFITCLTDSFYPRAGVAVVRILEHLGHTVHFPREQTCCGQPMFNNGHEDEARALARRLCDVLEPFPMVVTPSGSCAAMIREHQRHLFTPGSPEHDAAESLAARTYEFVEFLVDVEHVDLKGLGVTWEGTATYHPSCHLRSISATHHADRLLEQIEGLEHAPLHKREQCCGFGGTFALKYPPTSGAMVNDKVDCIEQTGARVAICNDAGCSMNIAGACHRRGSDVQITSLAEIIAEGMGLLDP